jgi:hypothetical protein
VGGSVEVDTEPPAEREVGRPEPYVETYIGGGLAPLLGDTIEVSGPYRCW